MADPIRQQFPVGDTINGQLVQVNKPLPVSDSIPAWTGFASYTISTAVLGLGAIRGSFNRAFITVETNAVRFTVDGTLPTASVGHLLSPGDTLDLESKDEVNEFQVIRQGAADATLFVTFGNEVV